jgi:CheY-like chemotaxis protein
LVLNGAIEAALAGDLLIAMGASVARVGAKDAVRVASDAAANGMPFTTLLTDKANVETGAAQLLSFLGGPVPRAVVTIDPNERGDIPGFRRQGFNGYLVRPARPLSFLTQLFDETADTRAANTESALHAVHAIVPRSGPHANGISVLLAEDNDINALLACTVLEKSGVRVVRARDGAEAIAKARSELKGTQSHGFDLVLMDIHMPDMDGVEATRGIRELYPVDARPGVERPPIVALTANAFAEDRAAYLAAGLDDYLAKPFEKQDLAKLLARWQGGGAREDGQTGTGAA